jgi:hypothetical protein
MGPGASPRCTQVSLLTNSSFTYSSFTPYTFAEHLPCSQLSPREMKSVIPGTLPQGSSWSGSTGICSCPPLPEFKSCPITDLQICQCLFQPKWETLLCHFPIKCLEKLVCVFSGIHSIHPQRLGLWLWLFLPSCLPESCPWVSQMWALEHSKTYNMNLILAWKIWSVFSLLCGSANV